MVPHLPVSPLLRFFQFFQFPTASWSRLWFPDLSPILLSRFSPPLRPEISSFGPYRENNVPLSTLSFFSFDRLLKLGFSLFPAHFSKLSFFSRQCDLIVFPASERESFFTPSMCLL